MFGKLKHTNRCEECKKLYQYDNYMEPTKCSCGGKLVYIGFQPEMDSLTIMLNKLNNQLANTRMTSDEKNDEVTLINGITAKEITKEEAEKIENQIIIEEQENVEKPAMAFELKDIIDISKKVTNAQMVPAIKNALSEHSKEKINMLKENYPKIYESSLKYIGKKNTTILKELLG